MTLDGAFAVGRIPLPLDGTFAVGFADATRVITRGMEHSFLGRCLPLGGAFAVGRVHSPLDGVFAVGWCFCRWIISL